MKSIAARRPALSVPFHDSSHCPETGDLTLLERKAVARRLAVIIMVCARGDKGRVADEVGIDRRLINLALRGEKQTISVPSALSLIQAYDGITLDYLYGGIETNVSPVILEYERRMGEDKLDELAEKLRQEF